MKRILWTALLLGAALIGAVLACLDFAARLLAKAKRACRLKALAFLPAAGRGGQEDLRVRLVVRTKCHPEANGRRAVRGESAWVFRAELDTGQTLYVQMGWKGRQQMLSFLLEEHAIWAASMMDRAVSKAQMDHPG